MDTAQTSEPMQLPAVIRQGGGYGWISAAVLGVALALVSLIIPWLLSDRDAFSFLAVWLEQQVPSISASPSTTAARRPSAPRWLGWRCSWPQPPLP